MKIVASGASRHMNLGGPSIFCGIVRVWRHVFPGCEIVYHDPSQIATVESEMDSDYPDVRVYYGHPRAKVLLRSARRWKWLGSTGAVLTVEHDLLEEIRSADLFVDVWGIDFTDKLLNIDLKGFLRAKPLIRVATHLGVKAVHYTASYGPAHRFWTRQAAEAILGKRCAMVYCREQQSREILLSWGLEPEKLLVAPDTGLLMPSQPCSMDGFDPQRPCVGISVSHQIVRQWNSSTPYLDLIAKVCDRMVREWNVQIVLIPSELWNHQYDDRDVAQEIFDRIECTDAVTVFPAEQFSAQEQKGMIAACDMMLASRYHSVVASMSSAVPTVVIGWHHKYRELLERFRQQNMGLTSEDCTFEVLWQLCKDLWGRREEVSGEIRSFLPIVERDIYQAGEQLKRLYQSS